MKLLIVLNGWKEESGKLNSAKVNQIPFQNADETDNRKRIANKRLKSSNQAPTDQMKSTFRKKILFVLKTRKLEDSGKLWNTCT